MRFFKSMLMSAKVNNLVQMARGTGSAHVHDSSVLHSIVVNGLYSSLIRFVICLLLAVSSFLFWHADAVENKNMAVVVGLQSTGEAQMKHAIEAQQAKVQAALGFGDGDNSDDDTDVSLDDFVSFNSKTNCSTYLLVSVPLLTGRR